MVDTDLVRSRSEAFWGVVGNGVARWMTLAAVFVVLTCAIGTVLVVVGLLTSAIAPKENWDAPPSESGPILLLIVVYFPITGLCLSILGAPFLLFQKWIVGPYFPYLRWGYLAVAAYGPLLMTMWGLPWRDREVHATALVYEVIALVGAMAYARIGRSAGLFDNEIAKTSEP